MKFLHRLTCVTIVALVFVALCSSSQRPSTAGVGPSSTKIPDILYATVDGRELRLDLFVRPDVANPRLLVWVHGGAWRSGTKDSVPPKLLAALLTNGYAVASLDFRPSGDARFPAQIHDIKAAIRFLRGQAATYGYNVTRVGILGASSGGHLAALAGVTNRHKELEGQVGDYLQQSSEVQAVVSYCGASNLLTILKQSTPFGLGVRVPALDLLFGGSPEEKSELARLASPVFHVDSTDPPLLLLHGDQDPQMPINQSHEIHGAYKQHGLRVEFEVVHGAAHGGELFFDEKRIALVVAFLDEHLR